MKRAAGPSPATVARFARLGHEVQRLSHARQFASALAAARQALQLAPGHPVVLGDMVLCRMRLGQAARALPLYEAAVRAAPDNENLLDGLAECGGHLDQMAAVRRHGTASLTLKDRQTAGIAGHPQPGTAPTVRAAGQPVRR